MAKGQLIFNQALKREKEWREKQEKLSPAEKMAVLDQMNDEIRSIEKAIKKNSKSVR